MEAKMYQKISSTDRFFEEYFCVEFHGKGFPKAFEVLFFCPKKINIILALH